ncbi:uncharacterized protein [Hyperolius riggenbachi]|uniref:uncharacterized protein isoform X2 n=1 Tax=Hyperolius riggenbachi TaxID=752182 RepID=UPI0035A38F9E
MAADSAEREEDGSPEIVLNGNILGSFTESKQTRDLIVNLQMSCMEPVSREVCAQRFNVIMDNYQEQPHLLDPHLGEGASGSTGAFVEHRHATTHLAEGESDVAATTGESAGDSAAEYLQSQDDIPESVEGTSGESAVDSAAEYRQGQDDIPESVEGASGAAENTGDIGEDQHVVLLLEPILEQEVSDLRTSADVCTMEHEECEAGEFVLHMSDESHTTELLSSPTSETFTATNVPSRP